MTKKELEDLLKDVNENTQVLVLDSQNTLFEIDSPNTGLAIFSGACDDKGNLIPDGEDVESFVITIKKIE